MYTCVRQIAIPLLVWGLLPQAFPPHAIDTHAQSTSGSMMRCGAMREVTTNARSGLMGEPLPDTTGGCAGALDCCPIPITANEFLDST